MHNLDCGTVFIAGVNGTGKTTLLSSVESRLKCPLIKGSSFFMQWLGLTPGDYSSLINLPEEVKATEQEKVMRHIATDLNRSRIGLLDAHLYNINQGSVTDATGDWMGLYRGLCVVTAPAQEVLARVNKDLLSGKRQRNLFPPDTSSSEQLTLLEDYLSRTTQRGAQIAQQHRLPYLVVTNNNGHLSTAVTSVCNWVETLSH